MSTPGVNELDEEALYDWLQRSISRQENVWSRGNQGQIFLYRAADQPAIIVKVAPERGLLRGLYALMLRHEYRVYRRLQGLQGVPRCYGLLRGKYLLLEYIQAETLRAAQPQNRELYFGRLLQLIQNIHARGVAHVDLKRKDNILVKKGDYPFLIDFGVAAKLKHGYHPLNRYLYHIAKRFDLNAWVKHKYRRQYQEVSAQDRIYLKRTLIERFSRLVKRLSSIALTCFRRFFSARR